MVGVVVGWWWGVGVVVGVGVGVVVGVALSRLGCNLVGFYSGASRVLPEIVPEILSEIVPLQCLNHSCF